MHTAIKIDNDVRIDKASLRKAVLLLRAIRLPICRKIISALDEMGEACVSDLVDKLSSDKIVQPVVSRHLGLLRRHKIVIIRSSGQKHYYKLNYATINKITNAIQKFMSS